MTTVTTDPPVGVELDAIGTTCRILAADPGTLTEAAELVRRGLAELDDCASRFRPESEVMHLARLAESQPVHRVPISPLLARLLEAALHAAVLTDGLVTPLTGRAVMAAGYDADIDVVRARPHAAPGAATTSVPHWRDIRIHSTGGRQVVDLPAGSVLDLGSTAKAVTADRLAEELEARFGTGFLVDLGGDIATAGQVPGPGWAIGVEDEAGRILQRIQLEHSAVATSSTSHRSWWAADGTRAHHIIDPRTGRPARATWETATVVAASALEANAASTAAIILGDRAPGWLAERHLPALLVTPSGVRLATPGWPT